MATAFTLDRKQWPALSPRPAPALDGNVGSRIDVTLPRSLALLASTGTGRRSGQRALAREQRRAAILAAARALFDEGGSGGVTVRGLAARSGVTVPTIYKLIGGRGAVVEQALLEGLRACIEAAPAVAMHGDVNIVSAYADTLWSAAATRPAYTRHLVELCARTPGGRRVGSVLRAEMVGALSLWLAALCDADRLDRLGGAPVVASALDAHLRSAFIDWMDRRGDLPRLRRDLATGAAIFLTGLLDPDEQVRLHHWLDRFGIGRASC